MSFDVSIFHFINNLANHYKIVDLLGIFLAKYLPYLAVIVFFIILYSEESIRKRLELFFLAALGTLLGRGIVVETIRFFYNRTRPFAVLENVKTLISYASDHSFPSGHASFYFALALALFYYNREWGIIYLAVAALISVARVFVGIHFPADIFVGAVIGILSTYFIKKILDFSWHKDTNNT